MKCLICNQYIQSTKGISRHLRSNHNITTRQYYDKYLKKPNEGICPMCGKPTKYYNFTKGYNSHCSVKCSSLDPIVQEKLKQTNLKLYGVDVGFKTDKCIKKVHSKESINKKRKTMLERYNLTTFISTDEAKAKKEQTLLNRYGVTNSYQIPSINEKALKNAQSADAKQKRHNTKKLNGWSRSTIEENFTKYLTDNKINFKHNYKSDNYPWKVDYYLIDLDLYIEINAFWTHNKHFYDKFNKDDNIKLNLWKNKKSSFFDMAVATWSNSDIKKRDWAIEHKLNYIVLWNKEQVAKFIDDLENNESFKGFIDYNNKGE